MLEKKHEPLATRRHFRRRLGVYLALSVGLAVFALGIGTVGYHFFAAFGWVDSLLNAAMILTGMGPVGALTTTPAKLFATAYALFSGLVFLTMIVTVLTPVVHRFLHAFNLVEEESRARTASKKGR